jgi:hypothetical protein
LSNQQPNRVVRAAVVPEVKSAKIVR